MTDFDDNITEGIENVTAVLTLSEYTLSLGVRLNQNSSTAIINIEDSGESVASHHWDAAFPLLVCPAEVVSAKLPGSIVCALSVHCLLAHCSP